MSNEEIKELGNEIMGSVASLRTELDSIKGKVDSLDDLKLDKIVDDITLKMEKSQKAQQEAEAKMKSIEAAIQRSDVSGESATNEYVEKSKEAFREYLASGEVKHGFKVTTDGIEVRAMSTDVNPDGGYLVRPEFADFIVGRVFETSPLRGVARVISVSSKSLEVLVDDNEAAASWSAEGSTGGETSTPQLGLKEIVAHKIEADPRVTAEMIQDSAINIEQWLQGKVAEKFARTENTAFVNGTGVAQPRGFLTYAAATDADTYERDKIGQFNLGATSFTATAADGLIQLQSLLKEAYQPNAVWGMKRATYGKIMKTRGNDAYFFGNTFLKDGNAQPTLLGKPVVFMDDMPAEGSNNLAVVYADFGVGYTIIDRVGLQVLRDPFSSKPFVTYYTTKRVGGDVTNFDAIKLGKLSA